MTFEKVSTIHPVLYIYVQSLFLAVTKTDIDPCNFCHLSFE